MYLNVIGYKQAFSIICSPRVSIRKENISSERTICAQSEDNHGEQFLIKPWLCPKIMKFSKIQGEQIIEIALLCPTSYRVTDTTINEPIYPRFHSIQI
jgi:hypothetical protein